MYKIKILLVDDEEQILKTLGASLDDEGYDIFTAGDGTSAMDLVRTEHPDIIFLDIWIPGMDGIEKIPQYIAMGQGCALGPAGCPRRVHQLAGIGFTDPGCRTGNVRFAPGKKIFIIDGQVACGVLGRNIPMDRNQPTPHVPQGFFKFGAV